MPKYFTATYERALYEARRADAERAYSERGATFYATFARERGEADASERGEALVASARRALGAESARTGETPATILSARISAVTRAEREANDAAYSARYVACAAVEP